MYDILFLLDCTYSVDVNGILHDDNHDYCI